jgi:hypothetical protein
VALAAPIDKGFNRLAWALPYGLGTLAAAFLGYGAYRLAKRPPPPPPPGTGGGGSQMGEPDPELADKLDDELRNLD